MGDGGEGVAEIRGQPVQAAVRRRRVGHLRGERKWGEAKGFVRGRAALLVSTLAPPPPPFFPFYFGVRASGWWWCGGGEVGEVSVCGVFKHSPVGGEGGLERGGDVHGCTLVTWGGVGRE